MEIQNPNPPVIDMDRYARRMGGKVFLLGATLQLLLLLLGGIGLLVWMYVDMYHPATGDERFWYNIMDEDFLLVCLSMLIASIIFALGSWMAGRYAGPLIHQKRGAFGWVGLVLMAGIALAVGFCFILMLIIVMDDGPQFDSPRFAEEIAVAVLASAAFAFAPQVVISPICGLIVRQLCRMRVDKTAKARAEAGLMESAPIDHPIAVV
jgi:hypothetical protein